MPNIGIPEMLIVLVIALIILGPKKLPDAGRSLGAGLRSFKDAVTGTEKPEEIAP
jgi:sec-independent protein translocase protein TatA